MFFIPFYVLPQNSIEDFNILKGKWKLDNDKFVLIEEWEKINDTTFTGLSYTLNGDKKNISEKLYLLKLNHHIVYIAQPGNNSPTLFTLVSSDSSRFVFENKEHDFPQKIIYHFITDSILNASIEGDESGATKRKEFNFNKLE